VHKTCLFRVYEFSSAHRLNSYKLDDKQNWSVYDKCNNLNGHGHDYTVEVGITGKVDRETGMIIDLAELDARVNNVLNQLDYKFLDKEVPYFKNHISTGENIIRYIWQELEKSLPKGMLYYLKLWETNNNYFELKAE